MSSTPKTGPDSGPADEYTPAPGELEMAGGTAFGRAATPDAAADARTDDDTDDNTPDPAELQAQERDILLKSGIALVVVVTCFMFGVWSLEWSLLHKKADRPEDPHEITTAISGLHRAMHGQGVSLYPARDPAALDAWVKANFGPHASVPDLSAADLQPVGARRFNVGKGFGVIRYQGRGGDVVVVVAPRDMMAVPAAAEAVRVNGPVGSQVAGIEIWTQATPTLHLVYVPGALADWALVAAPGEADLPGVARVLLAGAD